MLAANRISKSYPGTPPRFVLRSVELEIGPGEYVAIMGESGSGKSTLLNLIAGLETPDSGSICFEQVELTALDDDARTLLRRDRMGFVFQAFHLLPHLTARQNVALPLTLAGVGRHAALVTAGTALAEVGMPEAADRYPGTFSGGELQRIAIARALVHRPRLLLADEPTGNLDTDTARLILDLLRSRLKDSASMGILVTHSAAAAASADRVLMLSAGELRPHPI